jgi:hypothetical protein
MTDTEEPIVSPGGVAAELEPRHLAHVASINERHSALTFRKYAAGQIEHKGQCWEKPGMLAHALDEAADLPVYLWTLRDQLLKIADQCDQQGESVTAARIRFVVNK